MLAIGVVLVWATIALGVTGGWVCTPARQPESRLRGGYRFVDGPRAQHLVEPHRGHPLLPLQL